MFVCVCHVFVYLSVCVCALMYSQAKVVTLFKTHETSARVLAIGDGANDVKFARLLPFPSLFFLSKCLESF